MKKLFLSLFIFVSSFCGAQVAFVKNQDEKSYLREIKAGIISALQMTEENLKLTAAEHGDLCIVPTKIVTELLAHESIKKMIKKFNEYCFFLIIEKQDGNLLNDPNLADLFDRQEVENAYKLFEDISKKYESEGNEIFQRMLERCRENDYGSDLTPRQCTMLHTSMVDLVRTHLILYGNRLTLGVILQEIDALL